MAFPEREITHLTRGPGECVADDDRLAQAVGNLVSNAATYGRRGTAIVVRSEIEGRTASLMVHNEGEAIPADLLANVFEPMVRGTTGNNSARSVGLGLFIVKEIAAAHDGKVEVNSTAAAGTDFTIRFPSDRSAHLVPGGGGEPR